MYSLVRVTENSGVPVSATAFPYLIQPHRNFLIQQFRELPQALPSVILSAVQKWAEASTCEGLENRKGRQGRACLWLESNGNQRGEGYAVS